MLDKPTSPHREEGGLAMDWRRSAARVRLEPESPRPADAVRSRPTPLVVAVQRPSRGAWNTPMCLASIILVLVLGSLGLTLVLWWQLVH